MPERVDGPTTAAAERVSAALKRANDACELLTGLAETCQRLKLWCSDRSTGPVDRSALQRAQLAAVEASRYALQAAQQLGRVKW
jgi:hypothetical protein